MRASIEEIISDAAGQAIVRLSSDGGTTLAKWSGAKLPVLGSKYSVELDADVVVDDSTAVANDRELFALDHAAAKCLLSGKLESVDSDGMGYLRLARDCL